VSRDLWLCHTELGMPLADIKHIILNGFKAAFLPFHQRQDYVRRIAQELKQFNDDGTMPPRASDEDGASVEPHRVELAAV
jgi:adenosine deaminase